MSNRWIVGFVIACLLVGKTSTLADAASNLGDWNIKTALTAAEVIQMGISAKKDNASNIPLLHLAYQAHPDTKKFEAAQKALELTSEILIRNHKLSEEDIEQLNGVDLNKYDDLQVVKNCKKHLPKPQCDFHSRYRTYDGSCNNPRIPRWGAAFECYRRKYQVNYINVGDIRESVNGGPLPPPRTVSLQIHYQVNTPSHTFNNLVTAFGQFLAHDVTYAVPTTRPDNSELDCCNSDAWNPQCSALEVSPTDPFYSKYNVTCLTFARTAPCPSCKLGKRNSMTQNTAFIDASTVYSSNEKDVLFLRNYDGTGTLRTQSVKNNELLPPSNDPEHDECSKPEKNEICFLAGDNRCNLRPALTSMHTVFLREHNNIAKRFKIICPRWDEEKLFQETRRIVGAEMQVITYNEYLTLILGPTYMRQYDLDIRAGTTNYNDTVDPTIWPEFNYAAFRYGHSEATRTIARNWPSSRNEWELRNSYFKPFYLYQGLIDPLFEKITGTAAKSRNRYTSHDVNEYLMKEEDKPYGLDLIATDIMRGRDNGLPTYTQAVENCKESKVQIRTWQQLYNIGLIPSNVVDLLKDVYSDPRDIDLFTGLYCETSLNGAHIGPTSVCIVANQFQALRYGDRFYFQHGNQAGSFTDGQRAALKDVTLSQIICSNTKTNHMPSRAIELPSARNPMRACSSFGRIDLTPWMNCK